MSGAVFNKKGFPDGRSWKKVGTYKTHTEALTHVKKYTLKAIPAIYKEAYSGGSIRFLVYVKKGY